MNYKTKLGTTGLALIAGLYISGCGKEPAVDKFSYLSEEGNVITVYGDDSKIIRQMYGQMAREDVNVDLMKNHDKSIVDIVQNRKSRDNRLKEILDKHVRKLPVTEKDCTPQVTINSPIQVKVNIDELMQRYNEVMDSLRIYDNLLKKSYIIQSDTTKLVPVETDTIKKAVADSDSVEVTQPNVSDTLITPVVPGDINKG